jgi:hypothetical protein
VIGYQGEPYLRFGADGTVHQNERSPSRWLNDDRYGEAVVPPDADRDADPDWVVVTTSGSYAWHDHRTHWMNTARPPGASPGDTVLEAVVPLLVDGDPVDIHVRSILLNGPSPLPATSAGAVVAVLLAVGWWCWGRRGLLVVVTLSAAAAAAFGIWAHRSVPPETGPSLLLWALPTIGLASAVAAGVVSRRSATNPAATSTAAVLLVLTGFELVVWAWIRRAAVVRALIPSDAPFAADRMVVVAAAVAGLAALLHPLAGVRLIRGRRPGPRPAR